MIQYNKNFAKISKAKNEKKDYSLNLLIMKIFMLAMFLVIF